MVWIQWFTGMRSSEICGLRKDLIDQKGAVWVYRPQKFKNQWRSAEDMDVFIGPKAQRILRLFMNDGYCFNPRLINSNANEKYNKDSYRRSIRVDTTPIEAFGNNEDY